MKSIKISVICILVMVSLSPASAQSSDCVYEGGLFAAEFTEPFADSAERETMWSGIRSISSSADRDEKTFVASSELELVVIGSTQGSCPDTIEMDVTSTSDSSTNIEIGASEEQEWTGEIQTGEVNRIPVKVSSEVDYDGNASQMTEEELDEIRNSALGGATFSYDVDESRGENVNYKDTIALVPGSFSDEARDSALNLVDGIDSYTTYVERDTALNSSYRGFVDYTNRNPHGFEAYVWKTAYARPVGEYPESLDQYRDLKVRYQDDEDNYVSPENWVEPQKNGVIALDELSKDQEWLIFPASCITREDSDYYRDKTGTAFFHRLHTGLSNDNWVCGFNKPLYLPDGESETPPSFEESESQSPPDFE